MYCKYCGKEIADDAVFCSYCGKTQETDSFFTEDASAEPESDYEIPVQSDEPHGYILKSLNLGEDVIMQAHVHVIRVLHWIILAVICVILAFVMIGTGPGYIIFFFVLAAIFAFIAFLIVKTTELGFTNKRLIGKKGFIWTNSLDSPLPRINDVRLKSGAVGKIFGFGTLLITTASANYSFSGIAHAKEFRNALMSEISLYDENIHSR